MILNGCRLGFYEPLRKTATNAIFKDANVQSLGINIFTGASSGILGAAAGSPFFLVKTRLQSYSPFLPVGTQHGYKNAYDGLRKISASEGIKGLYRGVGAAMVRTGFGSSVQLPTYFFAKRRLVRHLGMEEGPALHLASSAVSGFVVCCVMHPPGRLIVSCSMFVFADLTNARYDYVEDVQPDREFVLWSTRLSCPNGKNRRVTCHIQRLFCAPCQNIATHDPDLEFGRANKQTDAPIRR